MGTVGSLVAANSWRSAVATEDQRSFDTTTTGSADTLNAALQRDADAMATARTLIATNPSTTNAAFGRWFDTIGTVHRYPGSFAFAYIQAVTPSQLSAFSTVATADPPAGLPIPGSFALDPPGIRPLYCLMRDTSIQIPQGGRADVSSLLLLDSQFANFLNPGVDECTGSQASLLHASAASGDLTVGSFSNMLRPVVLRDPAIRPVLIQLLGNLSPIEMVEPVYSTPASLPGQPTAAPMLLGWVGGIFDSDDLLAPVAGNQPNMSYVLSTSGGVGSSHVLASYGTAKAGYVTRTFKLPAEGGWVLTLSGVLHRGPSPDQQGAIVLLLGLVLMALLVLVFWVLSSSRDVALALVEEKTGELRHLAHHDPLTGLPNRTLIMMRTDEALERAREGGQSVALFFIDLDGFKDINDANGHAVGDFLLRAVADRFTSALRTTDTVGRLGGDEFVVLAEGSPAAHPERLAERLLAACANPIHVTALPDESLPVTASIGVATGPRDSAEDMLRDADIALYQAKGEGKGRYVLFEPAMRDAFRDRVDLDAQLREALKGRQFFLKYQPMFQLDTMRVVGVEALIRWEHPVRGVVPPDEFIPSLEQSGLIVEAGRYVLDEACRQMRQWHDEGIQLQMSVNVSARQLETDRIVDDIRSALFDSGLPATSLILEITETGLMQNSEEAARRLQQMKRLGARVAIDDFGTGYSSLAYLQQFPADVLKIDGSFIAAMSNNAESTALVHAMVQLGGAIGLDTYAEGIESPEQLRLLRIESCGYGQGNLLCPASTVDEVEPLLREGRIADPSTPGGTRLDDGGAGAHGDNGRNGNNGSAPGGLPRVGDPAGRATPVSRSGIVGGTDRPG